MSDEQIIKDAIAKALDSGWQTPFEEPVLSISLSTADIEETPQLHPYIRFELDGAWDWCLGIPHLVYDHDFAKALWGDGWHYHLQQMVVADDPVKYVGEYI